MRLSDLAVSAVIAVLVTGAAVRVTRAHTPMRLTVTAISDGGPHTTSETAQVAIVVDRWSTPGEQQQLRKAAEWGQGVLLETVQTLQPVGHIRTPYTLAYDLRYAYQEADGDNGRRTVLVTDRPVGLWEALYQPRAKDYPFTFIELRLDQNGQGAGQLSLATRLTVMEDGRIRESESYAVTPVRLTSLNSALTADPVRRPTRE